MASLSYTHTVTHMQTHTYYFCLFLSFFLIEAHLNSQMHMHTYTDVLVEIMLICASSPAVYLLNKHNWSDIICNSKFSDLTNGTLHRCIVISLISSPQIMATWFVLKMHLAWQTFYVVMYMHNGVLRQHLPHFATATDILKVSSKMSLWQVCILMCMVIFGMQLLLHYSHLQFF